MENSVKAYLTPADVFSRYFISIRTQNEIRHKRKIVYAKLSGKVIYKPEWVEDYIARQTRPAIAAFDNSNKQQDSKQ